MKANHMQPIVTNARQGLPVSTLNRPRRSYLRAGLIVAVLVLFWGGVAFIVSCIA
jgi:hypothetical protein